MADFRAHFGLDIGSTKVRVIQLAPEGNEYKLVAAATAPVPKDALKNYTKDDKEGLVQAISAVIKESNVTSRNVIFSVPESRIYSSIIEMPQLSDMELENALKWEVEQYVPLAPGQIVRSHQVLYQPPKDSEGKMEILLVAAAREVIDKYMDLAKALNLEAVGIESEILAVSRAVSNAGVGEGASIVVCVGTETTDLAVIGKNGLGLTRTVTSGGEAITRAISMSLSIDPKTAEEYKKTYGLNPTQLDGKVAQACKPTLNIIVAEVRRAIAYFQGKWPSDPIKRVVLAGSAAYMSELVPFFAQGLSIEVQIVDPFVKIIKSEKQSADLAAPSSFSVAVGLGLKEEK